jgi:hypothetical protein
MPPAGAGSFSATDLRRRMAEREAAKAAEELRHMQEQEQEEKQKAVMAEFYKSPERTAEQVLPLVSRAAERGQSEVQVYRFPNSLCSDRGRRINHSLPDWEETLEGRPRLGYEFWRDPPEATRLWVEGRSARVSGRDARRYRLHPYLVG